MGANTHLQMQVDIYKRSTNQSFKSKKYLLRSPTLFDTPEASAVEERRMVLLGVDNAGKTTTLEQLKALFGVKAMSPERTSRLSFIFLFIFVSFSLKIFL